MLNDSFLIKILGKIKLEIPELENEQQLKIRNIIAEELDKYVLESKDTEIMPSDLEEKIILFLSTKEFEGMAKSTLKNYKQQLRQFSSYINKPVITISVNDIRQYLNCIKSSIKESTLATKIFTLKSFFGWLLEEEYITKNPMTRITQPKVPKRLREAFTQEEIEILRQNCITPREKGLFEFALATGCRLSEITQLNIGDIDWSDMSVKVIGKGDKQRQVFFDERAKLYLKQYINSRTDSCEALFVTTKGERHRLGNRSVQRVMSKIGKQAKMNSSVFIHRLRHSMATNLLNSGTNIVAIQNLLGHSELSTTQRYAKLSNDNIKMEYKRHFNI